MESKFQQLKYYLVSLGYQITSENAEEELVVVQDEDKGISNLIIDCEAPVVIFEQHIGMIKADNTDTYKKLLQINRGLVQGAFVLDEDSNNLFYRNTLMLENLDMNEVEGSISGLRFAMAEHGDFLLQICK